MLNGQHKQRRKPRNLVVIAMIEAGKIGGPHIKSTKADRLKAKQSLLREVRQLV